MLFRSSAPTWDVGSLITWAEPLCIFGLVERRASEGAGRESRSSTPREHRAGTVCGRVGISGGLVFDDRDFGGEKLDSDRDRSPTLEAV